MESLIELSAKATRYLLDRRLEGERAVSVYIYIYIISWINLGKLVLTHLQVDQVRSLSNLCVGIASE